MIGTRRLAAAAIVAVVGFALWRGTTIEPESGTARASSIQPVAPAPEAHPTSATAVPTASPPRPVRVSVTSLDGKPVPGARVELFRGPAADREPEDFIPSIAAPRADLTVAAGDDGAATFADVPPGRWFLAAEAPGFGRHVLAGITRDDGAAALDTSVALDKSCTFAGTIRSPDGAPAAGVVVILESLWPPWMWPSDAACFRTTTAADGTYAFAGIEPRRYRLWYAVRPDILLEEATVLVPGLDGLDVRMVRGAAVEGSVRDDDTGAPIANARVLAVQFVPAPNSGADDRSIILDAGRTDSLGHFTLSTWRRSCTLSRLVVDAPGYVPTPVGAGRQGPSGDVVDGQRFAFDVRLRRAVTMTGTVVGPEGPMAGVRVAVSSADVDAWPPLAGTSQLLTQDVRSAVTGVDGRFRIERLPCGKVNIAVHDAATNCYLANEKDVALSGIGEARRDVVVELQRRRITRRIVDSEKKPIADVDVTQDPGLSHATARTGADGVFTLEVIANEHMPDGLRLRRDGYRQTVMFAGFGDPDGSDLTDDNEWRRFEPILNVTGTVTRTDGTALPGARVQVMTGFQGVCSSSTNWTGIREAHSGPDGTFQLAVTGGPNYWISAAFASSGNPSEADAEGKIQLKLDAPVHLAGRVIVAGGDEPVVGAAVRDENGVLFTRTGADGSFAAEIPEIWADKLRVTADGRLDAPVDISAEPLRIEMLAARNIAGIVRTADGSPAAGLRVSASLPGDPAYDGSRSDPACATDADGRFRIDGLDAGSLRVTVTDRAECKHRPVRKLLPVGTSDAAFIIEPAVRLEITVVEEPGGDDAGVYGAVVSATPEGASEVVDETQTVGGGRASLALAPDKPHTIRIAHDGYVPAEIPNIRGGGSEPLRIVLARAPR